MKTDHPSRRERARLSLDGGIVSLSAGRHSIPVEWAAAREPLPAHTD